MSATPLPANNNPLASFEPQGVSSLDHLGVIEVSGIDNASFLQGQLSNDVLQLSSTQARLAAFCSAKGRMQASFIAVKRENGDILLVCSKDLLAPTLKRLSMFVMRAKAKLRDASGDFSLYGLMGPAACIDHAALAHPWQAYNQGETSVVQLYPAQGVGRQLWLVPTGTPSPTGPDLPLSDWHCGEVMSGVATVSAPLVEAFVPQMLNYESVGGVSFKKGCYPGQEVVARSQFRGTLKRRAFLAHADAAMQAGNEIFQAAEPDQPCGTVAQAATAPTAVGGGWDAIVALQLSAVESGDLHLGSATGPALTLSPPPYPLLADI
jgi:folate-binding protein YgfZ